MIPKIFSESECFDMQEASLSFQKTFHVDCAPQADAESVFLCGDFRFSVLTSRLLRVEERGDAGFTDAPTQIVWFRKFPAPKFAHETEGTCVIIRTADAIFRFDLRKKALTSVTLKGGKTVTDFKRGNLLGTARTLDGANGAIRLSDGLMSRSGVTVLDDRNSCLLSTDGTVVARPKAPMDCYYFAYGTDYRACLRDFFRLTGAVPLIPRFCLGNWWSRYKDYTQGEYQALMQEFLDREIPITVATIDMDWHWVDVKARFGTAVRARDLSSLNELFQGDGWTGYSWNTELFPNHRALLDWLNEKGFKVTLNLHPAQGVRFFEDQYEAMARAMGIDPATKQRVKFDIANPKFIEAYFDVLHRPMEKEGVRFWWIDWQQERTTAVKGLDPLWALNHYHTLAFNTSGLRPLILSRYAGLGSHRYQVGFSGDTHMTWKSLAFQPYFTANATNAGYTWWSHDIGGHMFGVHDDELYARWVQLGEFSPIMRLHSTKNPFMGKEPWKYAAAANAAATAALRERHAMIPFLYAANRRTHREGRALIEPMYYAYPDEAQAYDVPNQYLFGDTFLVCPITCPVNKTTLLAPAEVWLPEGRWTDWYTGAVYNGGQKLTVYRGIEHIPVFAKAGAIVPLSDDDRSNDWTNPAALTLRLFRGTNTFDLYEDDGESTAFETGASAVTTLRLREAGRDLRFTISKAKGDRSVLPESRTYTLIFDDISDAESIQVRVGGRKRPVAVVHRQGKLILHLLSITPDKDVSVELHGFTARQNKDKTEALTDCISRYQLSNLRKLEYFGVFLKNITKPLPPVPQMLKGPLEEILRRA